MNEREFDKPHLKWCQDHPEFKYRHIARELPDIVETKTALLSEKYPNIRFKDGVFEDWKDIQQIMHDSKPMMDQIDLLDAYISSYIIFY